MPCLDDRDKSATVVGAIGLENSPAHRDGQTNLAPLASMVQLPANRLIGGTAMVSTGERRRVRMRRVRDALLFPFTNITALLRIGLIPSLIALTMLAALIAFAGWPRRTGPLVEVESVRYFGRVLLIFILGLYAAGVHRLIVRNERPRRVTLRFSSYEQAYWAVVGIFALASFVEGYLLDAVLSWIGMDAGLPDETGVHNQNDDMQFLQEGLPVRGLTIAAITVILMWLHVRLSLMFPHAAVTGRISPCLSWRATAGSFWRMIGAGVLLFLGMLPLYAVIGLPPVMLVKWLAYTRDTDTQVLARLALIPAAFMAFCLVTTIIVAFMSFVYKDLVDDGPPLTRTEP
jgi:hypothetical protein